jgi:hypothetical protein
LLRKKGLGHDTQTKNTFKPAADTSVVATHRRCTHIESQNKRQPTKQKTQRIVAACESSEFRLNCERRTDNHPPTNNHFTQPERPFASAAVACNSIAAAAVDSY